jgi:methionyl-tRNA formyltransferase
MRVVCFCNNWLGWQALQWLTREGEELVAVVVHPAERAKYAEEIRTLAAEAGASVIDGAQLRDSHVVERIRDLKAEMGVSVLFGYILREPILSAFPRGCINLHPALLPFNRGAYPNVWSIVEKTPAGVTLHYLDKDVDTGDIIAQEEVPVSVTDTGASLYQKLQRAGLKLFQETWPSIRSGAVQRKPQEGAGTFHRIRDVDGLDEIFLERSYRAGDLLNMIRARTFPPHAGVYFRHNGRKVYVRVELCEEEIG